MRLACAPQGVGMLTVAVGSLLLLSLLRRRW